MPQGHFHPGMSARLGACQLVEMHGSNEVMFARAGSDSIPRDGLRCCALNSTQSQESASGHKNGRRLNCSHRSNQVKVGTTCSRAP